MLRADRRFCSWARGFVRIHEETNRLSGDEEGHRGLTVRQPVSPRDFLIPVLALSKSLKFFSH